MLSTATINDLLKSHIKVGIESGASFRVSWEVRSLVFIQWHKSRWHQNYTLKFKQWGCVGISTSKAGRFALACSWWISLSPVVCRTRDKARRTLPMIAINSPTEGQAIFNKNNNHSVISSWARPCWQRCSGQIWGCEEFLPEFTLTWRLFSTNFLSQRWLLFGVTFKKRVSPKPKHTWIQVKSWAPFCPDFRGFLVNQNFWGCACTPPPPPLTALHVGYGARRQLMKTEHLLCKAAQS